jgi:hypothetical protein
MENDSKTGSSGSSYISSRSYTYTIDLPDPPPVVFEWFPVVRVLISVIIFLVYKFMMEEEKYFVD